MKTSLTLLFASALLFIGCSSKPVEVDATKYDNLAECSVSGETAPKWVCGISASETEFLDVGFARTSQLGAGFTRKEALTDARANLSHQISTVVKDKTEAFARSTGITDMEVADKVSSHVSKQVSHETLNGSRQINYWQHPKNGDIYILVAILKSDVGKKIKSVINDSYKNDSVLWQQFQSQKALDSLEASIIQ